MVSRFYNECLSWQCTLDAVQNLIHKPIPAGGVSYTLGYTHVHKVDVLVRGASSQTKDGEIGLTSLPTGYSTHCMTTKCGCHM